MDKKICFFRRTSVSFLLMTAFICLCGLNSVKASGITAYLTSSSSYDLNNDGKADTISVTQPGASNNFSGRLYVNGKKLYEFPAKAYGLRCQYRVITLQNGRRFILLSAIGSNPGISDDVLLQYTAKRKVKKIISFKSALNKFGGAGLITQNSAKTAVKVSGNTLTIIYQKMLWTTGGIDLVFKFAYKDGTLKRSSYKGNVDGSKGYITAKSIQTYKTTSTKNKSVLIKKNATVYVKKYYLKGSKMWLQLKDTSGRSGWIKCLAKNPGGAGSPYFSNGYYAG